MPVRVKCGGCGQVLLVRDELVGRMGKCPSCLRVLAVPDVNPPAPPAGESRPANLEDRPANVRLAPPPRPDSPANSGEEIETVEPDEAILEVRPAREVMEVEDLEEIEELEEVDDRPRRRRTASRRDRDEDEDDDDDFFPRRSGRDRHRRGRRPRRDAASGVLMGIAALLLVFLGLTTLFDAHYQTIKPPRELQKVADDIARAFGSRSGAGNLTKGGHVPDSGIFRDWEGKVVLGLSVLVALLAGAAVITFFAAGRRVGDVLVATSATVSAGWALLVLLLLLGYAWQALAVKPQEGGIFRFQINIYPGVGLWLGILTAMAVVGVSIPPALAHNRAPWLFLALGFGFVAGLLWMLLDIKPWDPPAGLNPLPDLNNVQF